MSGREDLNLRPLAPHASALAGLRHAPIGWLGFDIPTLAQSAPRTSWSMPRPELPSAKQDYSTVSAFWQLNDINATISDPLLESL